MGKSVSLDAVLNAALLLIEASPSGTVTTLEVKELLRYLGYSVVQKEVSELMEIVADSCDLSHTLETANGFTFKVYEHYVEEEEEEDVCNGCIFCSEGDEPEPVFFQFRL